MSYESERVRANQLGALLTIELNRPETINALNLEMVLAVDAALDLAEADTRVRAVAFTGQGARGFCAGGDVRQLYFDVSAGDFDAPRRYFSAEYALNERISSFGKPTVSFMHGVTMGGGVGLASHAGIRIVGESARVAMPETRIGFTPDVGGSWLLGRAPGRLGERLGLHGQTMDAAAAIAAGFADVFVRESDWPDLTVQLANAANEFDVIALVRARSCDPGLADFGMSMEEIDRIYALPTLCEITQALAAVDFAGAHELSALSPTALEVTLRSVRAARTMTLPEALAQEQRLAEWLFTERGDTLEGIRALLVDKDHAAVWPPVAKQFPI